MTCMGKWETVGFIVLIVLILIMIIYSRKNKLPIISSFNNVGGYADINDPYDRPYIIKNLITPEKCQEIINASKNNLEDSKTIGGKVLSIRNSKQCWISKKDPIVRDLYSKVSKIVGLPVKNAEELQVVRYQPDQYYNEHHDACCDGNKSCGEFLQKGGQRILTVLIYLSNDFEGGNTYFPNLDVRFKPKPGDAIVFYPLAKNSKKCHPYALHAGEPVTKGTKWVANMWFREAKFSL